MTGPALKSAPHLLLLPLLLTVEAAHAEPDGTPPAHNSADSLRALPPQSARAHVHTGRLLLKNGFTDGAIRAFQQALEIDPDHADAHYHLGVALKNKGYPAGAVRELRAYIRLSKDKKTVQKARELIRELGGGSPTPRTRVSPYIGAQACGECHRAKFEGFRQTAHHLTSRLPDREAIVGKFTPGDHILRTRNPNLWFEMSARKDGFYQAALIRVGKDTIRLSEQRIDIVTGSAKLGQTYLYWRGNRLYELPVSYFAATDQWINSPGFPDGMVVFYRPVEARCLECHATYFDGASYESNTYNKDNFVVGISCERCHGPGADHAEDPLAPLNASGTQNIVHPGKLEPQRQIEICAQCHAGMGTLLLKAPFSFRPGDPLDQYMKIQDLDEQNRIGVHTTNQVARLSKSKCFQESESMTCITCHNPHVQERHNLPLFSRRCITCHEPHTCAMAPLLGEAIRENCIDCHMPRRQDLGTEIEMADGSQFPVMPDHLIAVYPEVSRRLISQFSRTGRLPRTAP